MVFDVFLDIGIFYRKTCSLYKITNNNTTLLKIILSKIPNREYEDDNFISFIKLNPKSTSANSSSNSNAFIFTHLKSYFKNSKSYRNSLNNYTSKNTKIFQ